MPRSAEQAVDAVAFPTAERIARGDIVVTGKGRQARARVLNVVDRMDRDCQMAAAHILALVEVARFSGYKCQRFERHGDGGTVDMTPTERAEHARRALSRMWSRVPSDLALVIEYRLCFSESEQDVALRLGLSRGQVGRRFEAGLRAVAAVLRGKR